jgi:hypothetical protein
MAAIAFTITDNYLSSLASIAIKTIGPNAENLRALQARSPPNRPVCSRSQSPN